jgi:hypothetical protein
MRLTIIVLVLSILATSVRAGTLRDDFSDGNYDGWQVGNVSTPGSMWEVENRVLIGTRTNGWGAGMTIGELSWQDVTIEYDAHMTTNFGTTYAIGIILRAQDVNMHNGVSFWIGKWGQRDAVSIFIVCDNLDFVKEVTQPFPFVLNSWYNLRGNVTGNRYRFYVDDELLMDFRDDLYKSGRFGIIISGSKVLCDNVIITGNDVPDMNLSVTPAGKLATTWSKLKGAIP